MSKYIKKAQRCFEKIRYFYENAGRTGHSQALHFYSELGQIYKNSGRTNDAPIIRKMYVDSGKLMNEMKRNEDEHG